MKILFERARECEDERLHCFCSTSTPHCIICIFFIFNSTFHSSLLALQPRVLNVTIARSATESVKCHIPFSKWPMRGVLVAENKTGNAWDGPFEVRARINVFPPWRGSYNSYSPPSTPLFPLLGVVTSPHDPVSLLLCYAATKLLCISFAILQYYTQ